MAAVLYMFLVLVPTIIVVRGLMFVWLWSDFVQTVFTSAPDVDFIHALGLSLFVSFLVYQATEQDNDKDADEVAWETTVKAVSIYAMWAFFALIIKSLM
jgi:hypothetical protein